MKSDIKPVDLVPKIYAGDLPNDASEELIAAGISTHYQNDVFYVEWSDEDDYPNVKRWLTSTYGDLVKKYDTFALIAT